MKKFLSLLLVSAALFGTTGCAKKKQTKAGLEQQETVIKHFVQEEQAGDKKEDYSIIL